MSLGIRFGQDLHVIPVASPLDITTSDINTTHVKVGAAHRVTFLLHFGVITGDSIAMTVEESTAAATTGAEAIPFIYRLSGATGSDTWGAVTTADSTGVDITASDDGKLLMIDVDPSTMSEDTNYLSVLFATGGSMSECVVNGLAVLQPRYPQLDHVSTT
jgi:hypothetical protein